MKNVNYLLFLLVFLALPLKAQEFTLPITVSDGTNSATITFGVDEQGNSAATVAGLDQVAPPAPPSGSFDARYRIQGVDDYLTKFLDTTQVENKFIQMLYAAAAGQGPINLSWDPASLPQGWQLRFTNGTDVDIELSSLNGSYDTSTAPVVNAFTGARAFDSGLFIALTPVSSQPDPQAAAPTFEPAAGTYTDAVSVTLASTTPNASIFYTTDGSAPTSSSTAYTAAFELTATTTVRAIATAEGFTDSEVAEAVYTIENAVATYDVTFEVYMHLSDDFDPTADQVFVSGSFAGWPQPGTDADLQLSADENDELVRTISLEVEPGSYDYKFFLATTDAPNWDRGEWVGSPDRSMNVANDTTIKIVFGIQPGESMSIADARTLPDGAPMQIEGIITTPDFGFGRAEFYMQDETAGMAVFWFGFDYGEAETPFVPGAEVILMGERDSFNNLVQLNPSMYEILSNDNDLPEAVSITASEWVFDSPLQGSRVKISDVEVVDPTDWPTEAQTGGSAVNVEVTNGQDTFVIRIDRGESFFDGSAVPEGRFDITGVMGTFRETPQLFPFFEEELIPTNTAQQITISEARNIEDGSQVIIEGIVTTPDFGFDEDTEIFVQDQTAGIIIYGEEIRPTGSPSAFTPGDMVRIEGRKFTEADVIYIIMSDFTIISNNNPLPDPIVIDDIADWSADSPFQGSRVTLINLELVNASEWPSDGEGTYVVVTDGTNEYEVYFYEESFFIGTSAPSGPFNLTGVMDYAIESELLPFYEDELELIADTDIEEDLPATFNLNQNYPNPFNPSTQINYSLAKAGLANLEVFNLQGQKVAELVNQVQTAGTYSITFDAANLPSGVYLYRLSTPDGQLMRKMSLIK